jgi:hypothetical protein
MDVTRPSTVRPSNGFTVAQIVQSIGSLPLVGGDNLQPYVTVIPEVSRHSKVLGGNDRLVRTGSFSTCCGPDGIDQ